MPKPELSTHRISSVGGVGGYKAEYSIKDIIARMRRRPVTIARAIRQLAPKMERQMRAMAPYDTGRLHSSIKVRAVGPPSPRPRIEVTTVGYGFFQEYGTRKMAAQPFINPVVEHEKWYRQIRTVAKAIEEGPRKP